MIILVEDYYCGVVDVVVFVGVDVVLCEGGCFVIEFKVEGGLDCEVRVVFEFWVIGFYFILNITHEVRCFEFFFLWWSWCWWCVFICVGLVRGKKVFVFEKCC